MADMTDRILVQRACHGDLDAFEAVVQQYQHTAIAYAFSILSDYHAAEDAVQEAFVALWRNFESLRNPDAFQGWLRRLVFTQCNRQQRRRTVKTVDLVEDVIRSELPTPADDLEIKEQRDAIRDAVDSLPQALREVVMLYYFTGHAQKEVAAFLEVPVSTVNKRLHEARSRLKKRMRKMADSPIDRSEKAFSKRVIDKVISTPFHGSTVVGTVHSTIQAAGLDCSWARTMGILGHAFTFSMQRGCGRCEWEGNIDWWLFFDRLRDLGISFEHFEATQNIQHKTPLSEKALKQLKENTWTAVKQSIDRGVPAIAWAPMTPEQKMNGVGGHDWCLLAGYDESSKTYLVRSPLKDNIEYEVPFDGFGYADPVQWYCVLVPLKRTDTTAATTPKPWEPWAIEGGPSGGHGGCGLPASDRALVAKRSLEDAILFAKGTRFAKEDTCYGTDAEGNAAYELWQSEIANGTADLRYAPGFAGLLQDLRQNAADFLDALREDVPEPTLAALALASEAYRDEVGVAQDLETLCKKVRWAGSWDKHTSEQGAELVGKALAFDRKAIASIEQVVSMLDDLS